MRIPLDYYQILGVPVQTNAEQLQQAYRDRTLQLPQREYSQAAIEARNQLIAAAYKVLSEPEQRKRYDWGYFASTYDSEDDSVAEPLAASSEPVLAASELNTPNIEISDDLIVGALLILQELGEYELVLELGRSFLSTNTNGIESGQELAANVGEETSPPAAMAFHPVHSDIILTVALAHLELGREQWQQNQYENAASSLEAGLNLLLRQGLFPKVTDEIKADLDKLRPYRILELLAQPETNVAPRQQGLQLLRDILQERNGIDGTGNDGSGLSVEDFLRFIQQLRSYLSAAEQQSLFEMESRRPSAVATYLAVYALISRGFTDRLPVLIHQAKLMLMRLGKRQDLYLEQAICSLLLGQTLEASRALEQSQEQEPLAFIRENSYGEPDLLPGLCLYSESWLQNEVFPHFRDLVHQRASLKEYFANQQVQAYLEALPTELEAENASQVEPQQLSQLEVQAHLLEHSKEHALASQSEANLVQKQRHQKSRARMADDKKLLKQGKQENYHSALTTTKAPLASSLATSHQPPATSSVAVLPEKQVAGRTPPEPSPQRSRKRTRHRVARKANTLQPGEFISQRQADSSTLSLGNVLLAKKNRLILLLLSAGLGIVILWFLVSQVYGLFRQSATEVPSVEPEQLMVGLNQPPVPIPPLKTKQISIAEPLSQEMAARLLQTWLSTKAVAFGPERAVNKLKQILMEPALSQWQQRVQNDRVNNRIRQYKHSLKINSVQTKASAPNQAQVEATVNELAQVYQNGRLNQAASYDEAVRVRYDMVRQNGQWRIRTMQVLR